MGWPFFWFVFFGHAKKMNSPKGEKKKVRKKTIALRAKATDYLTK